MIESDEKVITKAHYLLLLAVTLLLLAKVSYMLISSIQYIFTIIAAFIFAGLQCVYWYKKGNTSVRKFMMVTVLLITLFSPLLFFLIKLFVFNIPLVSLDIFVVCSFIATILIMLYVDKLLMGLINT